MTEIPLTAAYADYLRDESRKVGVAESISFPTTEEEVSTIMCQMNQQGITVTTQGARTGIVAGAVPYGGHLLNLSHMTVVGEIGGATIKVQPGVLLKDLREILMSLGLFFPPDPTETTASLGGMAACNASGALTYHYGSMRNWVTALRVVLMDGSVLALRRGENLARGRTFSLTTEDDKMISGQIPDYQQPAGKSAAGYYVVDNMDMLDLFIGMEGTLGVITEIELRLLPAPPVIQALTVFLPDELAAINYVQRLRNEDKPVAIEFFNHDVLALLHRAKAEGNAFADIPTLQPHYHTAVYAEFHGEDAELVEDEVMAAMELAMELGGNEDDTWYADNARLLAGQKAFRHATPEAVNMLIDQRKRATPELTKLGTDMSVPDAALGELMQMYRDDLATAGLESVIFGHIGNNHLHVNILPRSMEEYARGKELYLGWAQCVVNMGGSVSAEHGIGKLKVPFLHLMYGEAGIAQMRALKKLFDPHGLLNKGTLF
ncbi:MAG: FAD-binding oxidoreductase [bacterium]